MKPLPRLSRTSLFLGLGAAVLLGAGASTVALRTWTGGVRPAAVAEGIAERLAADSTGALVLNGRPARLHDGTGSIYAARQGQPLWLSAEARAAALALLASAEADGLPRPTGRLDTLATLVAANPSDSLAADVDVLLTDAVLRHGDALVRPRVDAAALYRNLWFPAERAPDAAARLAEALAFPESDPAVVLPAWADALRPDDDGYRGLRLALGREVGLRDRPDLLLGRDLAPGDTGRAVQALRDRLALDALPTPGEPRFDEPLAAALTAYQSRLGLAASGRLDAATRRALNRRRPELIPLLTLNAERWRWLPADLGDLHVLANVPDFQIRVLERDSAGWTEILESRAVVGTRGWETPIFSDTMESVVFNPTWTIPASIQRQSYGRVDPRGMVKPPGPGNALGRVKFLFPNDHAVYIHDTPSKWAFERDARALSHGCVRSGDPKGLAIALLTRTNGWKAEDVETIFSGPWRLQSVELDKKVPVHITYFTAWADAAGRVRVMDDVYRYDARLAEALGLTLPDLDRPA